MLRIADSDSKRKKEHDEQKMSQNADFPNRQRNMILAAMFAITTMVSYAFLSGLIQIEFSEEKAIHNNQYQPPEFEALDPLFDDEQDDEES